MDDPLFCFSHVVNIYRLTKSCLIDWSSDDQENSGNTNGRNPSSVDRWFLHSIIYKAFNMFQPSKIGGSDFAGPSTVWSIGWSVPEEHTRHLGSALGLTLPGNGDVVWFLWRLHFNARCLVGRRPEHGAEMSHDVSHLGTWQVKGKQMMRNHWISFRVASGYLT